MIVVDTNIITYLYISGSHSHKVENLLSIDSDWNVPALWRSEFRSVLAQYLRRGLLKLDEALMIIEQAESLMRDNEYQVSSTYVMSLVNSSQCSAYDCEFVALAQHLDVPLITADKKILREFTGIAKSLADFLG